MVVTKRDSQILGGPFNTKEHIEAAIKAIGEIAADRQPCNCDELKK